MTLCSGCVPLDPMLTQCAEDGKSYVETFQDAPAHKSMTDIVQKLLVACSDSSTSKNDIVSSSNSSECTT